MKLYSLYHKDRIVAQFTMDDLYRQKAMNLITNAVKTAITDHEGTYQDFWLTIENIPRTGNSTLMVCNSRLEWQVEA